MEERSSNNELLLKFIKNFDDTVLTKGDKEVVLSIYNIIIDHDLSGEDFRSSLVTKSKEIRTSDKETIKDYLNKFYYIRKELINDIAVKSVYVETINQYFMPKIFEIQEQIESSITFKEQMTSTLKEQKKRHQEEKREIEEYERKQAEEKWNKMVEGNRERKQKRTEEQERSRELLQKRHNDTMQDIKAKHQDRLKHQEKLQQEMQERFKQQQQERIERSVKKKRQGQQQFDDYVDRMDRDRLLKLCLNYIKYKESDIYVVMDKDIITTYCEELDTIYDYMRNNISVYQLSGVYVLLKNLLYDKEKFDHDINRIGNIAAKQDDEHKEIFSGLTTKIRDLRMAVVQESQGTVEKVKRVISCYFARKMNSLLVLLQNYDQLKDPDYIAFVKSFHMKDSLSSAEKDDLCIKMRSRFQYESYMNECLKEQNIIDEQGVHNITEQSFNSMMSFSVSGDDNSYSNRLSQALKNNLVFLPGYGSKPKEGYDEKKEKELSERIQLGVYRYMSIILDDLVLQPEHAIEFYLIIKNFKISPAVCCDKIDLLGSRLDPEESRRIKEIEDYVNKLHVELDAESFYMVTMQKIICNYLNEKIILLTQELFNQELAKGYMYRYHDSLADERERFLILAKKNKVENENNDLEFVCDELTHEIEHLNANLGPSSTAVDRRIIQAKRIELSRYKTNIKKNQRKLSEYDAMLNEIKKYT